MYSLLVSMIVVPAGAVGTAVDAHFNQNVTRAALSTYSAYQMIWLDGRFPNLEAPRHRNVQVQSRPILVS